MPAAAEPLLHSYALLDMCRLPPVLLSGRLLLRSGSAGSAGGESWQQVFVLLTERSLLWLAPPAPAWLAVGLENASCAQEGEAFDVGTARHTLHFRCLSAALAARWTALVAGLAEQRTGNGLIESAEVVRTDRLEAAYAAPAAALMAMPSTQRCLERFRESGGGGDDELEPTASPPQLPRADEGGGAAAATRADEALAVGFSRMRSLYARGAR